MNESAPSPHCSHCRGANLVDGKLMAPVDHFFGIRFKPADNWISMHEVDASACLDCGGVTLRLKPAELKRLRDARRS